MGPLQPGVPNPACIPKDWPLLIIDLKDCFFTIPLAEKDLEHFPSQSLTILKCKPPLQRFQWRVLPQGMLNSPTICQHFTHTTNQPVGCQFPDSIVHHYMDDILIAAPSQDILAKTASFLRSSVASAGLVIAPEKIQHSEPWKYLGYILFNRTIRPQVLQIDPPKDLTLNRLQQLLGAINLVRPSLGIPTQ